jgi:tetratricopeptide (TPR) repeat protein
MGKRHFAHFLIGILAAGLLLSAVAEAASNPEQRRQELFKIMLQSPDNLDVAFEYAALSVQAGDLEGAIATLERMLIYAPGLPRVQLELGALYYRLGSLEVSRGYFESVLNSANAPPEVIERVKVYLAQIDEAASPTKFSAAIYAGLRWQSNANAAPDAREITLNGLPFVLGDDATSQDDWAFFTTGSFHYQVDLASQGDRLEADLVTYGAWQFEQTQLDTQLAELTAGPALNMARFGIDSTYLGIYGIANGAILDEDPYFGTLGTGLRLVTKPSVRTTIYLKGEYRHRWYDDTDERPNSSFRTGDEYRARSELRYILTSNIQLAAGVAASREEVRADFDDNWEYGVNAGATILFRNPVIADSFPWAFNVGGGYIYREFDAPDPTIDAGQSEEDDEYWVSGALNIPVREWLAIVPQAEYRDRESNYPTRDFEAVTVSLGLFAKF